MGIPEFIETQRLVLRQPQDSDANELTKLANNLNVSKNLGTMPYPYTLGDAKAWISQQKQQHGGNHFSFGLFARNSKNYMGTISVFNLMIGAPEFGFWLGEIFWGQGFMSEAAIALRDVVFKKLNAPYLLSKHKLENQASGKIAEKCGLKEIERLPLWSRADGKFSPGRTLKLERIDWERLKGL